MHRLQDTFHYLCSSKQSDILTSNNGRHSQFGLKLYKVRIFSSIKTSQNVI